MFATHNTENLRFIQIHAVPVRIEHLALSLPALHYIYGQLSLPYIEPSLVLSNVVACLPYLAMVFVLFWKYSEYLCSLQIAIN